MTYSDISLTEFFEVIVTEHIRNETDVFVVSEYAVIIDDGATAFLTSVLQSEQTVVDSISNIGGVRGIDTENAAFFV